MRKNKNRSILNPSRPFRNLPALALLSFFGLFFHSCGLRSDLVDRLLFGITGDAGANSGVIGATVVSANSSYCLPEDPLNGTIDINISLTKAPTADVTIPVSIKTGDENKVLIDKTSLTFTSSNWNTIQTVKLTGIPGAIVGNSVTDLVFGKAVSSDKDYNNYIVAPLSNIVLMDGDAYSVCAAYNYTTGLVTNENAAALNHTASFAVVLSKAPSADVNVPATITSSDLTEATVGPTNLTFTPGNWNTPQVITLTGVDDPLIDGDIAYTVTLPAITTADLNYPSGTYYSNKQAGGFSAPTASPLTLPAKNLDDDVPSITVAPLTRSFSENPLNNGAGVNEFTVVLNKGPAQNVTIAVTTNIDVSSRATLSTNLLTFTPANYNTPQTVTITPIDNKDIDHDVNFKVMLGVATNYGNTDPPDVDVTIIDDDAAGVVVTQPTQNAIENPLQVSVFKLRLKSKPKANVTIPINEVYDSGAVGIAVKPANRLGHVDKTSVTFTPANWYVDQLVTFTPINDSISDGNIQFLIQLQDCISTDADYNGLTPTPNITINYNDDDVAGFHIVANNKTDGSTTTYDTAKSSVGISGFATDDSHILDPNVYSRWTINLRSEPLADVTVSFTVNTSANDGTLNTTSLTFTAGACPGVGNWCTPQTVFLTGASNGTNEGNHDYSVTVTATGDAAYADGKLGYRSSAVVARPSFTIYSCDNDLSNKVVGCRRSGGFTTSETGSSATLWFVGRGSGDFSSACTVDVNSDDETEGVVMQNGDGSASTVGPPRVGTATITSGNYNTMTTGGTNKVLVTGQDDLLFDGNVLYGLVSAAPSCGGNTPATIPVRNTDNEQALVFTAVSGNTSENGTAATFQVHIGGALSSPATFTLACAAGSTECASVSPTTITIPADNTPQTVTVTGKDDHRADGTQPSCLQFGTISSADPFIDQITPPNACPINNDDNDKVIWVTTGQFNPNFNAGLAVADGYCGTDGNAPSWGSYKALLADSSTRVATTNGTDATGQVAWILQSNTEYYLKTGAAPYTGQVFKTNAYGLGTVGLSLDGGTFWTGLNTDWTTSTNTCVNWTLNDPGPSFPTGVPYQTNYGSGTLINAGLSDCQTTTTRKLICVQQ